MSSNFGISALRRVYLQSSSEVRRRVLVIYALLIGYNILAWALTLLVFAGRPDLVALALTAYTFGLRHAFDADHISAIDNVTRKLMQEKQRPVGVGLFFSLGHSTIVVILTVLIALAAVAAGSFTQLEKPRRPYRHRRLGFLLADRRGHQSGDPGRYLPHLPDSQEGRRVPGCGPR